MPERPKSHSQWVYYLLSVDYSQPYGESIIQEQQTSDLNKDYSRIYDSFRGVLSWQWDDRFETALAEFLVDRKDNIRELVESHLGTIWNNSNIQTAPNIVQMITIRLGNLREGQLLFTSDPNQNVIIYAAWWPWGNGRNISLRIGPHQENYSNIELTELKKHFRGWFSL